MQQPFKALRVTVPGGCCLHLHDAEGPITFDRYLTLLAEERSFARSVAESLARLEWRAFFWEHPPLDYDALGAPAHFAVLDAPALAGTLPDKGPFREHFARAATRSVASFESLGGDARLLAPVPDGDDQCCAHLADFVRDAEEGRVKALFRQVALTVREALGARPLWLSTSGLGVAWLHVRLDTRPKYYLHAPFRQPPAAPSGMG